MARRSYPPEFRHQLIALVRAGRTPESLAKEFEPSAQTIRTWAVQADRDGGLRTDGLTTDERAEMTRLRRENRQLKLERDILSKAAAWWNDRSLRSPHGRPARYPAGLRIREGAPGYLSGRDDVSRLPGLPEWVLRVA